ncbi:hypothetical protein CTI12_AA615840 [Artemisia annua]|uniref:Uncharacterized protein n=1 Tax=Artemisia annua TaxID=35608 RepID=A0A2U1KDD4_ARTAN|nr:hypothetical protein CTI12_AA615840 [Artemisia annua]
MVCAMLVTEVCTKCIDKWGVCGYKVSYGGVRTYFFDDHFHNGGNKSSSQVAFIECSLLTNERMKPTGRSCKCVVTPGSTCYIKSNPYFHMILVRTMEEPVSRRSGALGSKRSDQHTTDEDESTVNKMLQSRKFYANIIYSALPWIDGGVEGWIVGGWKSITRDQEGANKKLLLDQEGDSSSFEKEQITFRSCDTCFSQGSLAKDSYYHRRSQWILHAEWIKSVGESDEIDTDFKEWKLVIQEITKFLKVDTGFMNIRPLIYSLTLDLHTDNLPPVANVKRNLKLGDAILCSYHPNEVKFSEFIWSSFVQGARRCRGNKRQVLRFDMGLRKYALGYL